MAGWNYTNGKSNNAVSAENRGLLKITEIKKTVLEENNINFTLTDFKLLVKHGIIRASEWHHTNATFYNETNYYDLKDISIEINDDVEYYQNELERLKKHVKYEKEFQDKYFTKEDNVFYAEIKIDYIEQVGTKRYPRYEITTINYTAEVKNYSTPSKFVLIRTSKNENIRKTSKYITIVNKISKEQFEREIEKEKEILDKKIKQEKSYIFSKAKEEAIRNYLLNVQKIRKWELPFIGKSYYKVLNEHNLLKLKRMSIENIILESKKEENKVAALRENTKSFNVLEMNDKELEIFKKETKEKIDSLSFNDKEILKKWTLSGYLHPSSKETIEIKNNLQYSWRYLETALRNYEFAV